MSLSEAWEGLRSSGETRPNAYTIITAAVTGPMDYLGDEDIFIIIFLPAVRYLPSVCASLGDDHVLEIVVYCFHNFGKQPVQSWSPRCPR